MTINIPVWLVLAVLNIALVAGAAVYIRKRLSRVRGNSFWMVGEFKGVTKRGNVVWIFKGIFSDRETAVSECKGKSFFLVPVALDTTVTEETSPKVEYPNGASHGA